MKAAWNSLGIESAGRAKVKFKEEKQAYTVRATNERFAICTKPFNLAHTVLYTIIDWERGIRGTENLVFGFGAGTDEQCAAMLERLTTGETQVSHRNNIPLRIEQVIAPIKRKADALDFQSVLDSLERAADVAWLEEREEVAAGPEDRRVERLQIKNPLVVDLFCGLGGWAEGFLAEGYDVVGFDVERHDYGTGGYPGQLVLQDVLTLHGSQFSDAAVIVASPPCQEYSFMAMPWKRGKQIAAALRGLGDFPERYRGSRTVEQLNALFGACFRIQKQASEAAGRHIPLIVENVKGAQPWVGRAAWSFGSYYLWGDVPALMPSAVAVKSSGQDWSRFKQTGEVSPHWNVSAVKASAVGYSHTRHLTNQRESDAVKQHGSGPIWFDTGIASLPSSSHRRKAASAQIAKIPFALANWIARVFDPRTDATLRRSG